MQVQTGKRGRLAWKWGGVFLLFVVAAGVATWWHWTTGKQEGEQADEKRPAVVDSDITSATVNANPGFVGAEACRECHSKRCDEFQNTRHNLAIRQAGSSWMPAGFAPEPATLTSSNWPFQFQMKQSGEKFEEVVLRNSPAREDRHAFSIDLIYGSGGNADEVFFTWQGNRLYELPLAWLHPEQQWGKQVYQDTYEDVLRSTTTRCLECHSTFFEHVAGTENEYRRESLMLGVTCERCHGPGREHVTFHRKHPAEKNAQAIVRPARMSRERQMDLCAQCHSNAIHPRGPLFSYLPGEPLEEHFRSLMMEGIEHDHVTDQVKYLRRSKCFEQSDTLTCTTCHNPHRTSTPQVVAKACVQCHTPNDCGERNRLPTAIREQCVACHMPRFNRVAIKFHTETDRYVFPMRPHEHRIAVYPAARQELLRDWLRNQSDAESQLQAAELTESLADGWLAEGDGLREAQRYLAALGAYREGERAAPSAKLQQAIRETQETQAKLDAGSSAAVRMVNSKKYREAIEVLEDLLTIAPQSASLHAKLGTAYELVGRHALANEHWEAVSRCDPDNPYGHNMLGWVAYLENRTQAAIDEFRKADAVYPRIPEIHYRWALALLKHEDWENAESHFRTVLSIYPHHPGACQGLSHVLRHGGQFEAAISFATRAVQITKFENLDMLVSLSDAYSAAGQSTAAAETMRRAVDVARKAQSPLVSSLERRLAELTSGSSP